MQWIILPVVAYLLGSIPFGLVVAKALGDVDPRSVGSGNIGATNVGRACGTTAGVFVLALDILKGFLPVYLATAFGQNWAYLSLTALAAVLGHIFPLFLKFKGGKAVATSIGAFLPLAPLATLLAAAACIAVILLSGHVSLGSLTLALGLPTFALVTFQFGFVPLGLVLLVLLFWRHRENIVRLDRGEEHPWQRGAGEPTAQP
jgi:glycerol-3-phosphate acyltransferase PlsY